jgi:hypothetical protein
MVRGAVLELDLQPVVVREADGKPVEMAEKLGIVRRAGG